MRRRGIAGGLIGILLLGLLWQGFARDELQVIFFDVGQGDAILIAEGNNQVLIDGGRDGQMLLERLGRFMPFWDREIETVIETHPDEDHIGGLIEAFKRYRIGTLLKTNREHNTGAFAALEALRQVREVQTLEAFRDYTLIFPGGARLDVLHPFGPLSGTVKDTNATSIVAKLTVGEEKFLLMGDLSSIEEPDIKAGPVTVLKVGHHGSKYSTSDFFLDALHPRQAVISVGAKNTYGHPAPEVLARLKARGVEIWRTDEQGTIVYRCQSGETNGCSVSADR